MDPDQGIEIGSGTGEEFGIAGYVVLQHEGERSPSVSGVDDRGTRLFRKGQAAHLLDKDQCSIGKDPPAGFGRGFGIVGPKELRNASSTSAGVGSGRSVLSESVAVVWAGSGSRAERVSYHSELADMVEHLFPPRPWRGHRESWDPRERW